MYIRDNEATSEEFEAMSLPFTVPSASGQDIQLSSKYTHITLDNRAEYVRLAINYRCVGPGPPPSPLRKNSGRGLRAWSCARGADALSSEGCWPAALRANSEVRVRGLAALA